MIPQHRSRDSFRYHLLLTSSLSTLGFASITAFSIFAPLFAHFDRPDLDADALAGLAEHVLYLHAGFWPVVAVALLACIATSFLLFNRMSAPLVRFVRVFGAVERGELPGPIVIRAADYLQDEASSLNAMLEALRERRGALRDCALDLCELAEALSHRDKELDEQAEQLELLRTRAAEMRELAAKG
jgi:methyl-accepting chemotaxis protein